MVERRMGMESGVWGRRITELGRMSGRVRSLITPVTNLFQRLKSFKNNGIWKDLLW
jgi:hypothetical protein